MAVVQISKIQVRRGKANSNSGVPQLSSAEFAWAIDTQELYIGNGSVAEGAPYVGNTKILTEHDNLLDLASSYQFASTDTSITLSVPRGLQSKLDEYVSVTDFGAVGDGATDCTAAFTTAVDQLFRNSNSNYKKVLMVPNGTYLISGALALPSGTIIRGETQLGAVIKINANNIRFVTSTGLEFSSFDSSNRPQNINISNLTIQRTTGQVILSGVANSTFDNVRFKGNYILGTSVPDVAAELPAIVWLNNLIGTRVTDVKFKSCVFESVSVGIKCTQTDTFETSVIFENSKFFINHTGIYIAGVQGQVNSWQINDCHFEEIARQAFRSTQGSGTKIQRCKFKDCGNDTNTASSPVAEIVYFGENNNNLVLDCSSNRYQVANFTSSNTLAAVPEVHYGSRVSFLDRNTSMIYLSDSYRPLAVFSALNKYIVINYFLELGPHSRIGQLTLTVGDYLGEVNISDNYHYSPLSISTPEGARMTNFKFTADLRDNNADSGIDTIVLSYQNPVTSGATGNIAFDVSYGV
jgi:hypothetical protein